MEPVVGEIGSVVGLRGSVGGLIWSVVEGVESKG